MTRHQSHYKIRKITTKNHTSDSYGITIPQDVAIGNLQTFFFIQEKKELTQYNSEVIEKINETFIQITNQVKVENYPTIKKHWYKLREEINQLQNPLQGSIILTSGGTPKWAKEK